jgi:hypothetical protein
MSRITASVHFAFFGNHEKIPINGSPANAGPEIFAFSRPQNLNLTRHLGPKCSFQEGASRVT